MLAKINTEERRNDMIDKMGIGIRQLESIMRKLRDEVLKKERRT